MHAAPAGTAALPLYSIRARLEGVRLAKLRPFETAQ